MEGADGNKPSSSCLRFGHLPGTDHLETSAPQAILDLPAGFASVLQTGKKSTTKFIFDHKVKAAFSKQTGLAA
jgi:hypothetical protein